MIFNLILKDLKAYRKIFVLNFMFFLIAGNIFIFRYYPWHVYVMYGYLAFAFLSSLPCIYERNRNTDVLTCSLPVHRSNIVKARYITFSLITFSGLALLYLNGWMGSLLYNDSVTDFNQINKIKTLYMAVLFFIVHSSVFLPASFGLKYLGSILTFVVALVMAVTSVVLIFHPYSNSYDPYFAPKDLNIIILSVILIIVPAVSVMLSLRLYKSKDI